MAESIAKRLKADLEEIHDRKKRSGLVGYIKSGRESLKKGIAEIDEPDKDPSEYDLVIVGTPVWAGRMSSPVRGYLTKTMESMGKVAFFSTFKASGGDSAIQEMSELIEKNPIATAFIKAKSISNGTYMDDVRNFIDDIIL